MRPTLRIATSGWLTIGVWKSPASFPALETVKVESRSSVRGDRAGACGLGEPLDLGVDLGDRTARGSRGRRARRGPGPSARRRRCRSARGRRRRRPSRRAFSSGNSASESAHALTTVASSSARGDRAEVALLDPRDGRYLAVRARHVLRDEPADAPHRLASPFGGRAVAAPRTSSSVIRPPGPVPATRAEVDAELVGDPPHERRRLHLPPAGGTGAEAASRPPCVKLTLGASRCLGQRLAWLADRRRESSRPAQPRPRRRRSSRTVPAYGDGISTVALSVWISTSGSSSAIS